MNNKGFAASGILYTILLIFVVSMCMLLLNLQNRKTILDELKADAVDAVESDANYEYLLEQINILKSKIGSTDISDINDGTVTTNISKFNTELNNYEVKQYVATNYNDCGLTVTVTVQGNAIGVRIRGTTNALSTATSYAVIGEFPEISKILANKDIITRIFYRYDLIGQLRINKDGTVNFGYTKTINGDPLDIESGIEVYIDEAFIIA